LLAIYVPAFAENAQEYNNQGVNYLDAGDYEKASEYLLTAYQLDPGNKIIKKNLANSYTSLAYQFAEKENWAAAINYGEKAYELDNTNIRTAQNLAVSYNNYGYYQMKAGDFASANENYAKALKYDTGNWTIYVNYGNLMYQQGNMEEAVNYWQKALALHPDIPDVKEKVAALQKENKIGEKFNKQGLSHFEVKYEGYERQDLANKLLIILNEAYYRLGADFNCYPTEKVTVMIYTQGQYGEVTGNPNWLPGQSEGGGMIRVTAEDIEKNEDRLENVLYHEYTHILLYRKVGLRIAKWLDEGLAQYKEPNDGAELSAAEQQLLNKHLVNNSMILLADLENTFTARADQEAVNLAYVEAKTIILYLVDRNSFYHVLMLLDKLKAGKNINQALQDTFYLDQQQFEQGWLSWLKGKY